LIHLLIDHKILSYNGYYKMINSANINKNKPISEKLSQYRYWLRFLILAEFVILYCKDSLGSIDNNNIDLINNLHYVVLSIFVHTRFY
jgi:hypothetical protein